MKTKSLTKNKVITIRDPIHGSIILSPKELKIVNHPAFQRLRHIKQLGFIDLAFPGATNSRYSHSLGAMHVATRIFDKIFSTDDLPENLFKQFRQIVRLAVLLHDVGHAPLSHSTEIAMPNLAELQLKLPLEKIPVRRATHEDYTFKLITDSSLADTLAKLFSEENISPLQIAELLSDAISPNSFVHNRINYRPILKQIVSSECDADRMDYLLRDSFYCGVSYGKFDLDWLIANLISVEKDNSVFMGITSKAIFTYEDFLLSRYHMFASVYLHHTPIIFDKMLEKYLQNKNCQFKLPVDIEAYISLNDLDLLQTLRQSKNSWAKKIVNNNPYFLLHETKYENAPQDMGEINREELIYELNLNQITCIQSESKTLLSKYYGTAKIPFFVVEKTGMTFLLEDYTQLFKRYQNPAIFYRIYIDSKHKDLAIRILSAHMAKRQSNGQKN